MPIWASWGALIVVGLVMRSVIKHMARKDISDDMGQIRGCWIIRAIRESGNEVKRKYGEPR